MTNWFSSQDFSSPVVLGLSPGDWLLLASGILVTFVSLWALRRFLHHRITRLKEHSATTARSIMLLVLGRTQWYFLLAISLASSAYLVGWSPRAKTWLLGTLGLAVLLQCGRWADGLLEFWAERERRRRLETGAGGAALVTLMGLLGRVLVWSIIVLLLLDNAGIDVTALMAGLGIGGIAIGLGLQGIIGDLFASLSIMLDRPFAIGDFLAVGEYRGSVEDIGLKSTRLRSLGGEEIVFSNRILLDREIRNFGRMRERRIVFNLGVTYETKHALLLEIPGIVRAIIEEEEIARVERAHFKGHGDSALDFEFVYFVEDTDYGRYMDVHEQISLKVHQAFEDLGIEFAFPTRTVHVRMEPS